jgi:hypothetical protein
MVRTAIWNISTTSLILIIDRYYQGYYWHARLHSWYSENTFSFQHHLNEHHHGRYGKSLSRNHDVARILYLVSHLFEWYCNAYMVRTAIWNMLNMVEHLVFMFSTVNLYSTWLSHWNISRAQHGWTFGFHVFHSKFVLNMVESLAY